MLDKVESQLSLPKERFLKPVNGWREVINLPVVAKERNWSIEQLESITTNSIKATVEQTLDENEGKIFTTLSGGVDSSLCLALIRRHYPEIPIHTFTVCKTDKHPDLIFARKMAVAFGTIHHPFIFNDEKIAQTVNDFNNFYQGKYKPDGNVNPWLAYEVIASMGAKSVIAHDGIDELMGGYWPHRRYGKGIEEDKEKHIAEFEYFWSILKPDHLLPLEETAGHFNVRLLLPYLQRDLVEYISRIPVTERATREEGKTIWRTVAKKYLPEEITRRAKFGFGQALEEEEFIAKNLYNQKKEF